MPRLVTILLLVALLLAACGGPEVLHEAGTPGVAQPGATSTPRADGNPVTISFAAWEHERQVYTSLAERFTAENPDIRVVIVPMEDMLNVPNQGEPDSQFAALRRVVSGADTAPAFIVPPEALGTNLLLNLQPLMDADPAFDRSDFYPGSLERYTVAGGVWLLPRYFYVQLLSYNNDLFTLENLPEPEPGWSWSDLLGAAEQIAGQGSSLTRTYGFLDQSGGFLPLVALLEEQGIDIFALPVDEVQFDDPVYEAVIERVQELQENGVIYTPYGPKMDQGEDPHQLIREGRVGIWPSEFAYYGPEGPTSDEYPFDVGQVPYPQGNYSTYFSGGNEGYIISGGTVHPNEAWKWIEFLSRQLTDPPHMEPGFNPPGRVPARESLAEQTGFWDDLDEEAAAAYRWAIENTPPVQTQTPEYAAVGALSQAMYAVINENRDPRQALREAQQQLEEQVAQLTPTPEPDTSPVFVATPEPQEAPEGTVPITFAVPGFNTTEMRRIARAFRDERPDLFVEITSTDYMTGPVEITQLAQTNDCFSWWSQPRTDEEFAALLDLRPLFDADPTFPLDDYPEAVLGPYQRDGGLFGLPYTFNVRTLNYNRTAFDAEGLSAPTHEWTPDDFLAAAQALTEGQGEQKRYGYVPIGGPQQDLFFFISQFGASLTTGSGEATRPNFDDPQLVQAIQWYIDLYRLHEVMPRPYFPHKMDDYVEDRSYELLSQGRAGMWFDHGYGGVGGMGRFEGGVEFEAGVAPLPIGAGGLGPNDIFVRGFHISASTENPEACWEWLKFLSADVNNMQGGIPARTSVAQSEEFASVASPDQVEIARVYAEALDRPYNANNTFNEAFWRIDTYWFFKAISEAVEGETDLSIGLADAQEKTTAFLDCLDREGNKPATCAREVDPDYQGYNTDDPPLPGVAPTAMPLPAG